MKAEQQSKRQKSTHPVRSVSDTTTVELQQGWKGSLVNDKSKIINSAMQERALYEPVHFVEEMHVPDHMQPLSNQQRYRFFEQLQLAFPVTLLRYCPGGSHTVVVFLWKVDADQSKDTELTQTARIMAALQPKLPVYHTRQMKTDFKHRSILHIVSFQTVHVLDRKSVV